MRFLIDAQLPPSLTVRLRQDGHDADHVAELGLTDATDVDLAQLAESTGAVLVSKDADFLTLRRPDRFPFVWLRCGNATNRVFRAWLAPRWPIVMHMLAAGERMVEVR